mgnify:CR=1 FL=1
MDNLPLKHTKWSDRLAFDVALMLGSLAVGMLVPAVTGLFQTSPDWQSFIISACITGFFAVALILTSRGELRPLTGKQAFVLTGFSWLTLTAFAALPLNFSLIGLTYTDSFFEAMSEKDRMSNPKKSLVLYLLDCQ